MPSRNAGRTCDSAKGSDSHGWWTSGATCTIRGLYSLTILGEHSNHINGAEQREYRFDLIHQRLASLTSTVIKCSDFGTICFVWRQNSEVTVHYYAKLLVYLHVSNENN